jgi:hypothetical protein
MVAGCWVLLQGMAAVQGLSSGSEKSVLGDVRELAGMQPEKQPPVATFQWQSLMVQARPSACSCRRRQAQGVARAQAAKLPGAGQQREF